jgi:hypothetical protein
MTAIHGPRSILVSSCDLRLGLLSAPFPRCFPSKTLCSSCLFREQNQHGEISGSDGGEYEDYTLLGYSAVQSRSRLTFQR